MTKPNMSKRDTKHKPEKGAYEAFRSDWLLQVAADREAKSAMPVAAVIAHKYLNRERGHAWPGVKSLMEATGAASENTVRNALRVLVKRGHAFIKWSDGGNGHTNIICPLVNKKPFKNLKGFDIAFDTSEHSTPSAETLQVSAPQPFKKLKATLLKEPLELQAEAIKASADVSNTLSHQLKDEKNSSSTAFSRLDAEKAEAGEEIENRSSPVHPIDAPQVGEPFTGEPDPSGDEAIFIPEADEIDLDGNTLPSTPTPEHLDGPHTGDLIEVGEGAFVQVEEAETDAGAPRTPTAFGGPAREEIIVNRALDWLKREIDADPRWVEYLVHQAATKSPQWAANVHGERVAHEIGHGVEETKRALAEALRQTIDTSGREIPGEDQQHTSIAIGF